MFILELDQNGKHLLDKIADKLKNSNRPPSRTERALGAVVQGGFLSNFNNERSGAGPWEELQPRTVRERISQGFRGSHPILERTMRYRSSFINQYDPMHHSLLSSTATGWSLEVGSRDPRVYALEGGKPRRNLPARPVTILDKDAERRIGDFLDNLFYQLLG